MTLKNRGQSKKTEGCTGPKNKGGSLAVGTYLQRGSAPPPPSLPGATTYVGLVADWYNVLYNGRIPLSPSG